MLLLGEDIENLVNTELCGKPVILTLYSYLLGKLMFCH